MSQATETHLDDNVNILGSIGYYIKNTSFISGVTNITMPVKYSGFNVALGYPQDFKDIKPPKITLEIGPSRPRDTFTWTRSIKNRTVVIEGFCGGLTGGEANEKQAINLLNDIENLFDPENGGRGSIDLLDFSTGTSANRTKLDTLRISDVVGQPKNAAGEDTLDILRYRFQVTMTVGLVKSQ